MPQAPSAHRHPEERARPSSRGSLEGRRLAVRWPSILRGAPSGAPPQDDGGKTAARSGKPVRRRSRRSDAERLGEPELARREKRHGRKRVAGTRRRAARSADAHRRRPPALARACRAEIASDPADRRPAARGACSTSSPMPTAIRSPARACSTCSPAPARSGSRRCRAALALRCSSMTAPRRAPCCARTSHALGLGGVTRIFRRDATKLGDGASGRAVLARLSRSALRPGLGRAGAHVGARGRLACARRADRGRGSGASHFSAPAGFDEVERRRYDTTEIIFLTLAGAGAK